MLIIYNKAITSTIIFNIAIISAIVIIITPYMGKTANKSSPCNSRSLFYILLISFISPWFCIYLWKGILMSKYDPLWQYIGQIESTAFELMFAEIEKIAGVPIDHWFLKYKKDLAAYGYQVGKISIKKQTVSFLKLN